MTAREREICEAIGPELKRRGMIFVGIDVIGGHLTEINVTSPDGPPGGGALRRRQLERAIWDAIEARRGSP
jgi:glutathione synthase